MALFLLNAAELNSNRLSSSQIVYIAEIPTKLIGHIKVGDL